MTYWKLMGQKAAGIERDELFDEKLDVPFTVRVLLRRGGCR